MKTREGQSSTDGLESGAMRRSAWLLVFALALGTAASCTKGNECDTCSTDSDCKKGLFCVTFNDDSHRCGSGQGASTCRVR